MTIDVVHVSVSINKKSKKLKAPKISGSDPLEGEENRDSIESTGGLYVVFGPDFQILIH